MRDFFDETELQPCLQAIEQQVDDLAERLYQANKINGFYQRVSIASYASAGIASAGIARAEISVRLSVRPSVRPSVSHTPVLYQNEKS